MNMCTRSLAARAAALPAYLLVRAIRAYQLLLSPVLGQNCRFQPTCSQYAMEAVRIHGAFMGLLWTVRRVLRCHPWHPGGADRVPPVHTRFYFWSKD